MNVANVQYFKKKELIIKEYFVYIMASRSRTLYVGMTGNLSQRVSQHKSKHSESFTKMYNITKLVYFESFGHPSEAILREKQLKGWLRVKKVRLIESINPNWDDLAESHLI